jgi:hypothetical protein
MPEYKDLPSTSLHVDTWLQYQLLRTEISAYRHLLNVKSIIWFTKRRRPPLMSVLPEPFASPRTCRHFQHHPGMRLVTHRADSAWSYANLVSTVTWDDLKARTDAVLPIPTVLLLQTWHPPCVQFVQRITIRLTALLDLLETSLAQPDTSVRAHPPSETAQLVRHQAWMLF